MLKPLSKMSTQNNFPSLKISYNINCNQKINLHLSFIIIFFKYYYSTYLLLSLLKKKNKKYSKQNLKRK